MDTKLPQRWIRSGGLVALPGRSPGLIPLDFFMWVYVKGYVFSLQIQSLSNMKERFEQTNVALWSETLKRREKITIPESVIL